MLRLTKVTPIDLIKSQLLLPFKLYGSAPSMMSDSLVREEHRGGAAAQNLALNEKVRKGQNYLMPNPM